MFSHLKNPCRLIGMAILCALAAALFTGQVAEAQSASLTGIITDSSGAVVSGAKVELTETSTQNKQLATSNQSGFYSIATIMPGQYAIAVTAPGFQSELREKVAVEVGAKLSMDFALKVGAESQLVTVDGSGEQINTTDASVSTVIDQQFVANLPLNGRSFQSLITLAPGTTVVPSAGSGSSGEISVNGQRTEANYYTIDGISANTGATVSTDGYVGAGFSGATPQESAPRHNPEHRLNRRPSGIPRLNLFLLRRIRTHPRRPVQLQHPLRRQPVPRVSL